MTVTRECAFLILSELNSLRNYLSSKMLSCKACKRPCERPCERPSSWPIAFSFSATDMVFFSSSGLSYASNHFSKLPALILSPKTQLKSSSTKSLKISRIRCKRIQISNQAIGPTPVRRSPRRILSCSLIWQRRIRTVSFSA